MNKVHSNTFFHIISQLCILVDAFNWELVNLRQSFSASEFFTVTYLDYSKELYN